MDLKWLLKLLGCRDEELQNQVNQLQTQLTACGNEKSGLTNTILSLNTTIQTLKANLDDCRKEGTVTIPDFLDTSEYPYMPQVHVERDRYVTLQDPKAIYTRSSILQSLAENWVNLPLNEKLMTIWRVVEANFSYEYDITEDWRFSPITWWLKKGDCEDWTILFVDLCKAARIPTDRYFNATGWFYNNGNKFGHSFPIIKAEDNIWKVAETTLGYVPSDFKILQDSNYDISWGICNHQFSGKIKANFNKGKDGKVQI
jgi:hypothetical protein